MTKEKFSERSQEIMAAKDLTMGEKREMLRQAATFHVEKTWDEFPEVRELQKRIEAAEKKHAGRGGYSYCPHDGEWTPDRPQAIKALEREWAGLKWEIVNDVYWEALRGEAGQA